MNLRSTIDSTDTISGKIFDWFIQSVILLSIVSFTLETLPNLAGLQLKILNYIELTCVVIFSIELILRVLTSEKGFRYLFTFYGVIDILAIAPFYFSLGIDLRGIRAFRLLRIFRLFKLTRYSAAMQRYHIAFLKAKEELVLFGVTALIIVFLAAVGIHYFEYSTQPESFSSIPACLWWAIATLTTVGYGDVYPVTVGGKIFTFIILAVGLAAVSVPSGIMATALTEARNETKTKK